MSGIAEDAAPGPLLARRDGRGVATLTLNRPRQFNALNVLLLSELQDALDAIARDRSVRAVVIAGAGKAFCAGHDLREMHERADPAFAKDAFERASRLMLSLVRLPQPVIARVNGFAYAAGCQLVAQCDLAVASAEATFATSGVKYGLFCSTPGVAVARSLPRKQALEMLLTGEPIDAQTALARGLVNRVAAPDALDAEVARLVESLLDKPAAVIAAGKRTFYEQAEQGLERAYDLATTAMACNARTDEAAEGIAAFAEKRRPRWKRT
jgi:enoyl-CoA hydratase/carnithine racemase